jgi:hypothetical protein
LKADNPLVGPGNSGVIFSLSSIWIVGWHDARGKHDLCKDLATNEYVAENGEPAALLRRVPIEDENARG